MKKKEKNKKKDTSKLFDIDGIEIVKSKPFINVKVKEKGSNDKIDFSDLL